MLRAITSSAAGAALWIGGLALAACNSRHPEPVSAPSAAITQASADLHHVVLVVRAAAQSRPCPAVSIKIEPVNLDSTASVPTAAVRTPSFTDVALKPIVDAGVCEASTLSAPLAPGRWRLSVPLSKGLASCERVLTGEADVSAAFEDGKAGC